METTRPYNSTFYRMQMVASLQSARKILPIVLSALTPRSVVDVGCGVGTWLAACRELGVADVTGIDGAYVDRSLLMIPEDRFINADLDVGVPKGRRYDLACCLEVAEHLAMSQAGRLLNDLTELADAVLFSAAIPYQGGTGHCNENWPEYWVQRFAALGYDLFDIVRPRFWNDPEICFWYRQNIFLFVRADRAATLPPNITKGPAFPLGAVHPELFLHAVARGTALSEARLNQNILYYNALVKRHACPSAEGERVLELGYGQEPPLDLKDFSLKRALRKVALKVYKVGLA